VLIVKLLIGIVMTTVVLVGVGWLGTKFDARRFDVPELETSDPGSMDVPANLPPPVARYTEVAFGEEVPVIESALIIGRADLTFNGITVPGRFKMYHDAGQAYYHYMQVAWFQIPVLTVHERFLDGVAFFDLPGSMIQDEPTVNAAANQGLWAESVWLPSIYFTDERVQWVAVDDQTAQLIVPEAAEVEIFTLRFDAETGLLTELSTYRYRDAGDTERLLWTNRMLEWGEFNGVMIPTLSETQWGDQDDPWAVWRVESVIYNLDVSARMAQFGGDVDD
jgi:hypothetical protein